jgi:hypothetical protein
MPVINIGFKNKQSLIDYVMETYNVSETNIYSNKFIVLKTVLGYVSLGFYEDLLRIDYFAFDNGLLLQSTKLTDSDLEKGWIIISIEYISGDNLGDLSVITYVHPPLLLESLLLHDKKFCIIPRVVPTRTKNHNELPNIPHSDQYKLSELFPYRLQQVNNIVHPVYDSTLTIYKLDYNNNIDIVDFTQHTNQKTKETLANGYVINKHDLIHIVNDVYQPSWFLVE